MTDPHAKRSSKLVGTTAPPLEIPTAAGDPWRLEDHRGQPVLLVFHRHLT